MMQKDYKADDIRNICMVGSSGAGKTILVESIASNAGIVTRMGSVEDGNTVSDYNEDEIERKISINLSVISFEHKNRKVNLIDTPGYADFVGEVFSGINVCEACILVISADTGIDASVENLWEIITQEGRSVLFFINKCDKENVDLKALIGKIESALEIKLTPMNASSKTGRDFSTGWTGGLDLSDEVVEAIASCDDSLIEKYINGEKIPDAELINGF
ncbi:MAG: GTP-binding protein, partial [Elusimicrobia bacterium]|nr:GTP-binding protein [Elusimicrobiota bacterium]